MNMEKILGLLYIIFGLLFVIYPIFSSALLSMIIGFSLVCFGLSSICMGIVFTEIPLYKYLAIILGIIAVIFGIMFMFFLNAVPFLVSLQFYIVGFLMILQSICKKCYGGNLISIHNLLFDNCISRWARRINQAKVWIGVIIKLWVNEGQISWFTASSFRI